MKDVSFLNPKVDGVNEVPFAVTGTCESAKALLQQVMILLFVSPDDPCRYMGGSFANDFKTSNIVEDNLEQIRNLLTIAITDVKKIIIAFQAASTTLTDAEKLSDIQISTLEMPDENTLNIALDVITVSGAAATGSANFGIGG